MKRKKALMEVFMVIITISPFILMGISPLVASNSEGYIENSIKIEGNITDKKIITNGWYNQYFFTLNGTIDHQTGSCIYDMFNIGDYIYITELGNVSKDGISFIWVICDDFLNTPYWQVISMVCVIIIIIITILFYVIILMKQYLKNKNEVYKIGQ